MTAYSKPQDRLDPALIHASNIVKPQTKFKKHINNSSDTEWSSSMRHKYNAQVPLGYRFCAEDAQQPSQHPYAYEIDHLNYPRRMFERCNPTQPLAFEKTPFTWVDTVQTFSMMLDSLRLAEEIALDLEYHSYRSFAGFVCLMQLSTREADFIIDTLLLREELEELNEVLTNPGIVKVLHGAESDIVWLQQNFNLYVVNLFDTYHASKVLGMFTQFLHW